MLEIIIVVLFCWLFAGAFRLTFMVTWGLAKILAVSLFVLALPTLVGCLLLAGGIVLLIPVAMLAIAWGILKTCI